MFYSAQEITTGQHYAAQKAFSELSQTIPFRDAFKKKIAQKETLVHSHFPPPSLA